MPEPTHAELQHEWEDFARAQVAEERKNVQALIAGIDARFDALDKRLDMSFNGDGSTCKGVTRQLDTLEQRMLTADENTKRNESETNRRQIEIIGLLTPKTTARESQSPRERGSDRPDRKAFGFERETIKNVILSVGAALTIVISALVNRSLGDTSDQADTARRIQEALLRLETAANAPPPQVQFVPTRAMPAVAAEPEPSGN